MPLPHEHASSGNRHPWCSSLPPPCWPLAQSPIQSCGVKAATRLVQRPSRGESVGRGGFSSAIVRKSWGRNGMVAASQPTWAAAGPGLDHPERKGGATPLMPAVATSRGVEVWVEPMKRRTWRRPSSRDRLPSRRTTSCTVLNASGKAARAGKTLAPHETSLAIRGTRAELGPGLRGCLLPVSCRQPCQAPSGAGTRCCHRFGTIDVQREEPCSPQFDYARQRVPGGRKRIANDWRLPPRGCRQTPNDPRKCLQAQLDPDFRRDVVREWATAACRPALSAVLTWPKNIPYPASQRA